MSKKTDLWLPEGPNNYLFTLLPADLRWSEYKDMNIQDFKSHFSHSSEFIHFNNSGQALIPDVNRDTVTHWINRFYVEGAFCSQLGWEQTDVTRKKLASFLGAEPEEVSFFPTTASALSQAAMGISLHPGDEILTWDQEYPSNFYPWRMAAEKSGAKLIQVKSENWQTPFQKILERVNSKTRVIAISWVQYQTGSVTDLKQLAESVRGTGIWLVADVIQGAGVRPLNFHDSGFDILCGGSHKWLCSSYGAGFMVTKKEHLSQLSPIEFGAMTFGTPDTEKSFANFPKVDGRKFEPGSKSMLEIIALGATLDLFSVVGIGNIFSEAQRLADRLRLGLKNLEYRIYSPEGPIVNFATPDLHDVNHIAQKLTDAKVSFAKRGPGIRLSLHAYNQDYEVDRVLDVLAKK